MDQAKNISHSHSDNKDHIAVRRKGGKALPLIKLEQVEDPVDVKTITDYHNNHFLSPRGSCQLPKETYSSDLDELKAITMKLKLSTKRPSFTEWREEYYGKPFLAKCAFAHDDVQGTWSVERRDEVNKAIDWLKKELEAMRAQDHSLARKLVNLRHDIHHLKLQRCYDEHKQILDSAMESEEHAGGSNWSDVPPMPFSPTLKQFGVTPMNLSARRFSVF